MNLFDRANALLKQFKGETYLHGGEILNQVGPVARSLGQRAVVVWDVFPDSMLYSSDIESSLQQAGVTVAGTVEGARPNAPLEDLARIAAALRELNPDVLVGFGGGSTLDAVKAAEVLRTLGGSIEEYFGAGLVSQAIAKSGKTLTPYVAIQTAASSASHLTKYSNITDLGAGQKKLIIDEAVVPPRPVFDYTVTLGAPPVLTVDGGLDGISHSLEVLYGAVGKPYYGTMQEIAEVGIGLIMTYLPRVVENPLDAEGRQALALGTDLGGYAIMIGGTNGAHLTSFSLIDVLTHGRACAMLNPYYTVFFAPSIQEPLRLVGKIAHELGYMETSPDQLSGRALGVAVSEALIQFIRQVGCQTRLSEIPGFSEAHITRALTAAKNPQLRSKLENMPVPLTAELVDEYMGPVLEAAKTGDLSVIRNLA